MITNLLDSRHPYPVFRRLCDFLDIQDIIHLTRTCKKFSGLYSYLLPILWNVDKRLERFAQQPEIFRSQMGLYDALITGSFAVQFFERVTWPKAALDIYIERGHKMDSFCEYLGSTESCTDRAPRESEQCEPFLLDEDLFEVRHFTTPRTESEIRVVGTPDHPLRTILDLSHSTVVVNFITWNKAYAIFPLPTFCQHRGYLLQQLDDWERPLVQEYSRRGWTIEEMMWPEDHCKNHPLRPQRRTGDQQSWIIPFNAFNVKLSSTPDYHIDHGFFQIKHTHIHQPYDGEFKRDEQNFWYSIEAVTIQPPILRHPLVIGTDSLFQYIFTRGRVLTHTEMLKLSPDHRPEHYEQRLAKPEEWWHEPFYKPDYWQYYDDRVPKWIAMWEEEEKSME
ncbi:uncharacterized protein KY384_008038 [Bacidia gigantensis]|uniref:uncharacterized protein n=1 Tax=Bacidia gigantensis TaxID=2732470 RepID=UPI001D05B516|nr:uncharacterized protein KY384_008038 [Bacidia gigantensis]KAG8527294.1 hypothetical protein KY384_008038 [Bacidia gigantensis]